MKKKSKQNIICFIIVITILVMTFSSCSKLDNENNDLKDTNSNEITTFTALYTYSGFDQEWGGNAISKEITKRTGVKLNLWTIQGSQNDALKVMTSSNDYPELLLSVDNAIVGLYADAGKLIVLDDYIDEYGVNIKSVFGDDINKMRYLGDGKIYGFNRSYKEISSYSDALFNVQYALLKEFNYPKIKTLDDLFDLMIQYKEKYPIIEGNETIGLSAWAQSYGMNVTLVNPALQSGGFQNDGLYTVGENFEVQYGLKSDEAHDYFLWLNKLFRNKLLDESSVIQGREAYRKKITSGSVLVTTTPHWDLNEMEIEMREKDLAQRCYARLPLTLSEDTTSHISNYDPNGSWKSVITDNCKDPQKAFKFFDMMWSEEMQVLCNWGIQDIHYDILDGKRVLRDEYYDLRTNDPRWQINTELQAYNFWCMGENAVGKDGQYINPFGNREDLIRTQDESTKEALSAYGVEIWKDLCPIPQPSKWGFVWTLVLPNNSMGVIAETKVQEEIRRKYLPQVIMSPNEIEFEENWTQFMEDIKNTGITDRENEIQQLLEDRTDSWD